MTAPVSGQAGGHAELVVFNVSGWTLIPSDQEVTDNGKPLVSLPRKTYQTVKVPAGAHELRLHGRKLLLNVSEGQRYFIIMGYRPERSAVLPIAGDPVVIQQVSEEEARPLLGELTPVGSAR
jgi:hypothetical protein